MKSDVEFSTHHIRLTLKTFLILEHFKFSASGCPTSLKCSYLEGQHPPTRKWLSEIAQGSNHPGFDYSVHDVYLRHLSLQMMAHWLKTKSLVLDIIGWVRGVIMTCIWNNLIWQRQQAHLLKVAFPWALKRRTCSHKQKGKRPIK
jgi:hypothetical protein